MQPKHRLFLIISGGLNVVLSIMVWEMALWIAQR
jgi:hypothetical protein